MQVIGNGFIGSNFKKILLPKKFIIYAAGVSNSNCRIKSHYKREINQIKRFISKINSKRIFIYISSVSVENKMLKKDRYVKNKLIIESIIKNNVKKYIIIRLPQIVGKNKNKHTLTNYIFDKLKNTKKFSLWKNSKRNLIDIDDVVLIVKNYLKDNPRLNNVLNIYNPNSVSVKYILKVFEKILKKKVKFVELNKKNKNTNLKYLKKKTFLPKKYYKIINGKNYVYNVLKKYYQ